MKNLLNISDLNQNDFEKILQFAEDLDSKTEQTLTNKNIGLIFEKCNRVILHFNELGYVTFKKKIIFFKLSGFNNKIYI